LFDLARLRANQSRFTSPVLSVGRQKQGLRNRHWIEVFSPEASRRIRACVDAFRQSVAPVEKLHFQSGNLFFYRNPLLPGAQQATLPRSVDLAKRFEAKIPARRGEA
jgi:hypothetical protein